MKNPRHILLTSRRQRLLYDLTALKLDYVCKATVTEHRNFAEMLYRQTTFYGALHWHLTVPQPEIPAQQKTLWLQFLGQVEPIFNQRATQGNTQAFTKEAATLVFPLVVAAEVRQCLTSTEQWFGCFRYDFQEKNNGVNLHFRNACVPASPFADMSRLFASLKELVADIEARGLAPQTMGCGSWINNLVPFQALFPPSYAAALNPTSPEDKMGDGWWGQFVSRKETLHKPRADLLRNELRFEFPRLRGDCPFAEFKAYITST